jgi:enoyl-CoA hydratase
MADIHFDTVGVAGIITLNRPKALNSLTEPMVLQLSEALTEWAADDRVQRVAIRGEGKAFSAGGDLRDVHTRREAAASFFAAEYRTNYLIKMFPKPYVAVMDGIVMGGGAGVSVHGSHRIASENIVFAMPEVGIGFVPDIGASHFLSEMTGELGLYLALTGARLGLDRAAAAGLVTHATTRERLADALDRTAHARDLDRALGELRVGTEPWPADETGVMADAFGADSVTAILERLDEAATASAFAAETARTMRARSPTSLEITFREIRRARGKPFAEQIRTEFRIVSHILEGHDFYEGIRAVVIDKDGAPRWSPASLAAVDPEAVEAHFEEPHHGDLDLPEPPFRR